MKEEMVPVHNERFERNVREHIELRLHFAEAVSSTKGIPLIEAMRDYTDLHVRITGKLAGTSVEADSIWEELARGVPVGATHDQILDYIVTFSKRFESKLTNHEHDRYYPFRYEYNAQEKAIHLHFGSTRPGAGDPNTPGILSKERFPEMRQKLKEMFTEIKAKHPDAEVVQGGSWLYNYDSYKRLYPASYTAHPRVRPGNKFSGGGTWGQFRDKTGGVSDVARREFLRKLEKLDPDNLGDVFPYKTLLVSGPISEFYKEYEIE